MATYSIFDTKTGTMPEGCEELRASGVVPAFVWALGMHRGYYLDDAITIKSSESSATVIYDAGKRKHVAVLTEDKKLLGNTYMVESKTFQPLRYTDLDGAATMWACLISAFRYLMPGNEIAVLDVLDAMGSGTWSDFEKRLDDGTVLKGIADLFQRVESAALSHSLYKEKIPAFGTLKSLTPNQRAELFGVSTTRHSTTAADASEDYDLASRFGLTFTEEEKTRIPKKEDWFIMPDEGYEIMDEIVNSTSLRNYWLIGKAGTGKTELAKQIAANLGVPYVFVNCGSGFDDAKIRGQFIPNPDAEEPADSELVSYVNSLTDTDFVLDADTIAKKIGAVSNSLSDIISKIVEIKNAGSANRPEFLWQDSPIVYAYSRPCVCEVQEADCIRDPGVLTNFNSILECGEDKFIQLDNGKILRKNPYCIYIFTSNMQYEGCRMINNAVFDRLDPYRLELPSKKVRANRVMKRTGFGDKNVMTRMVDIVDKIDKYMTENGLNTGVCGMRSLEHWAEALMIWQKKHPGEEIPEDVLEKTGARKVLAKTAQPEDELSDIEKVWYGLFSHDA